MSFLPLVAVRTFVSYVEAVVARSALEAAGIHAVIRGDDCGGVRPSLWLGGIAVLVQEHDLAVAREVLNAPTLVDASQF